MINDKTIAKVTNFLSKEFHKNFGNIAIFKNLDGSYDLFDKYTIICESNSFTVITTVESLVFSTLKNAVTWCVYENDKKYARASRIKHLDQMISGTEVAIDMHKKLLKKSKDVEFTLIHIAKLNEEKLKRASMIEEMDSYIQESIYRQTKKFAVKR